MSNSKITPALRKTFQAVEKLGEVDAKSVAEKTGREYGRESSYLNRLTRMGYLRKRRVGHQNLFTIKPAELTILKLGGSVITDKNKPLTPNFQNIKRISTEIANALKSNDGPKQLIVVHGGGSFGHPVARQYGFPFNESAQVLGFAHVQVVQKKLSTMIIDSLLDNNVPAIAIELQSGVYSTQETVDPSLLLLYLNAGLVPVICGNVFMNQQKKMTIMGSDRIVSDIARILNPSKVIVALDVYGLYTADPKTDTKAELIKELHAEDMDRMSFGPTKYTDVTGGMVGKIHEYLTVVRRGIDVTLINGNKSQFIGKALCGKKVLGTVIKS